MEYKLFIDGQWVDGGPALEGTNKDTGEVRAAPLMAEMPAHKRAAILARAAQGILERREEFARTIAAEAGKALKYARVEVERGASTFTFAAEEAKRLHGETVPLAAS